jgi:PAS domain S-box-containing protein
MAQKKLVEQLEKRIRQLELEIVECKKAIGDIQREQLFSEKVLDSMPGIFYLYDQDGNLIRWNKNHESLTGFTAEEWPRRKMYDWFYGKDKERVAKVVEKIYTTGDRADLEAGLIVKNGDKAPNYFTVVRMPVDQ